MLNILYRLPPLQPQEAVVQYWHEFGDLTQVVIAAVVVGYPFLAVYLADLHTRWRRDTTTQVVMGRATFAQLLMFLTALNVALGMASAGGQLIEAGHVDVGYALHVGAFVLAAPATGMGVGACAGLVWGSATGTLAPRWLAGPAFVCLLCNVGTLGGLFTLDGIWNSGNGLAGGIALPLGSLTLYVGLSSAAWWTRTHGS